MERLYRSQKNRIIGGVAGGLAEYFDVDVVLVRLLWVFSIFLGGGIPVYIIAWIIIPDEQRFFANRHGEDKEKSTDDSSDLNSGRSYSDAQPGTDWKTDDQYQEDDGRRARRHRSAGLILVGLGIFFLAYQLFGPLLRFSWPLLLVALGIYLLARERKEGER